MATSDSKDEIVNLENGNELRFDISDPRQEVCLQVLEGSAEIYGSQLVQNDIYKFIYFSSVAVFSTNGCVLKLTSSQKVRYQFKRSEVVSVVSCLHDYLESMRSNVDKKFGKYPITLLTGPTDVGKSTLSRFLLNYAVHQNRKPLFIDLDVGQSSLSIPGTFCVLPVKEPCDVNGQFNEHSLSVYFFGYKSPGHNITLYKQMISKLGHALNIRMMHEPQNRQSGVIIDTCGWIVGAGYSLILQIIESLKVNTVFAIGSNSHYYKLNQDLPDSVEIRQIPKLEGVSFRNKTIRRDNRDHCLHEYFYGSFKLLKPYIFQMHFNELQIYKAKQNKNCEFNQEFNIVAVPIESALLYQVFGLSYADQVKDILLTSVLGFICFIDINMESEVVSVLSPQPAPLPSRYLLMGDMTFNPKDHLPEID